MTSMPRQHKNHLERAQVAAAATVGYAEMEALKLLPSDVEREGHHVMAGGGHDPVVADGHHHHLD